MKWKSNKVSLEKELALGLPLMAITSTACFLYLGNVAIDLLIVMLAMSLFVFPYNLFLRQKLPPIGYQFDRTPAGISQPIVLAAFFMTAWSLISMHHGKEAFFTFALSVTTGIGVGDYLALRWKQRTGK